MCHMLADSTEELVGMANKIGVRRKWVQHEGTYKEHFDICLSKRALALRNGAVEVSQSELRDLLRQKRRLARDVSRELGE